MKNPDLAKLSVEQLLDRTLSKNGWEQEQARRLLRLRGADSVFDRLTRWLSRQSDPRAALEAIWLHDAFGQPDDRLIGQLAVSKDERFRAAAARQLSR